MNLYNLAKIDENVQVYQSTVDLETHEPGDDSCTERVPDHDQMMRFSNRKSRISGITSKCGIAQPEVTFVCKSLKIQIFGFKIL